MLPPLLPPPASGATSLEAVSRKPRGRDFFGGIGRFQIVGDFGASWLRCKLDATSGERQLGPKCESGACGMSQTISQTLSQEHGGSISNTHLKHQENHNMFQKCHQTHSACPIGC